MPNSKDGDASKWIKEITSGRGADIAVEGVGISITLKQCQFCTRSFGKVVAMGNPVGEMKLSQKGYWEFLRKQMNSGLT